MKKLLLTLLCAPLLMTGCLNSADYEPPKIPNIEIKDLQFKGKMTATPLPGSEFKKFEQENVEFSIIDRDKEDKKATLSLKRVRFVEQMPTLIDCEYRDLILMISPYEMWAVPADKNVPMYPYYMGMPLDINQDGVPDPEFKTTDLMVEIVFSGDKITKGGVKFHCNTMEVVIIGDPIASTTPTTPTTPTNPTN